MSEHVAKHPSKMEPTHPGAILREDALPALGLTVTEAARKLRVSRQMLHAILAERAAVSPEMAVRLGRLCGNGPGLWLRMQAAHDLWHAERRLRAEVRKIPELAAAAKRAPLHRPDRRGGKPPRPGDRRRATQGEPAARARRGA